MRNSLAPLPRRAARSLPRRVFSLLLRGLGALLLLLLLILGAACIWLRTPSATSFLADTAVSALQAQGLALELEDISGPLPERLALRGLSLADDKGPFFTAKGLEVRLGLTALLRRTVDIELVALDGPALLRLPDLPAGEDAPSDSGLPLLPVDILLRELRLEQGELHTAALAGDAPNNTPPDQGGQNGPQLPETSAAPNDAPPLPIIGIQTTADAQWSGDFLNARTKLALRHQGQELRLEADATLRPFSGDFKAVARLAADDIAAWQELALGLAGQDTESGEADERGQALPGGSLRLEAALEASGLGGRVTGAPPSQAAFAPQADGSLSLSLAADNLRWPDPAFEAMLGSTLHLKAEASGGEGKALLLRLTEARAGIFSASGSASLTPEAGGALPDALRHGELEADFAATASDLGALPGAPQGLSGALAARLTAGGRLTAPELALDLSSPEITLPGQSLQGLQVLCRADVAAEDDGLRAKGTLDGQLRAAPAGPVALATGWRIALPSAEAGQSPPPLTAALESLRLNGGGMTVNADLALSLPMSAGGDPADGTPAETAQEAQHTPIQQNPAPSLNGRLKADITDWAMPAALAGTPLTGAPASLELTLEGNSGKQAARAALSLPDLRLAGQQAGQQAAESAGQEGEHSDDSPLRLRDISLTASLSDLFGAPDIDAVFSGGPGQAGFLRWSKSEGSVKGGAGRGDFSLALEQHKKRAPERTTGRNNSAAPERGLALRGAYSLEEAATSVRLDEFSLRDPRSKTGLRLVRPLAVTLGRGVNVKDLDAVFEPGGKLTAEAAFSDDTLRLKAELADLPFAFFKLFGLSGLPDGALAATADFSGSPAVPRGAFTFDARLSAAQNADGPERAGQQRAGQQPGDGAIQGAAQGAGLPSALALHLTGGLGSGAGGLALRGQGYFGSAAKSDEAQEGRLDFSLPLAAGQNGLPLPDADAPLKAGLYWKGPVESLWQAVPLPDRYLSGPLLLDARVAGSMNKPDIGVRASMAGGRYEDITTGILVGGIDLEARNAPGGDVRLLLAANDSRSGMLKAEADLKGLQNTSPELAFRCQLEGFKPLHRDDLDVALSGYFGVNGPLDGVAVTGLVRVDHGELTLSTQLGGSVPLLDLSPGEAAAVADEAPSGLGPTLDLRLVVPRRFYIRGLGMDSEWQGDLRITGTAAAPSLLGSLAPVRGYLEFLARTFEFTGGTIFFDGGREINPGLNLELTYENPDITAIIRAGGSAKHPKISMDSRPPLPQDEVLAHVLFGKNVSDLSRFEAIQLADSMRQLTGFGGSGGGILTGVRQRVGLDMLRLGGNQDAQQRTSSGQSGEGDLGAPGEEAQDAAIPALEAGKYINDSIYLGVEQGVGQDSTAVRVEVELFPRVTLEGKSSSEASEVGLGWKLDY